MNPLDYDSCVKLLRDAKRMTKEFPPFVRGMGPEAAYWKGRSISKPSATTVKQFIELLDDARVRFLEALPNCPSHAKDLLNGFTEISNLQSHIRLHPAKEKEMRSTIRKLVYHADQFAVPHKDRVSFIEGKIRFETRPGIGDLEYFIFQSEIRRIARELLALSKDFAGNDLASAFNSVLAAIPPQQVVDVLAHDAAAAHETTGSGDSEDAARLNATSKVPEGAEIVQTSVSTHGKTGLERVSAFSRDDARQAVEKLVSGNATLSEIECSIPSKKGVLGIGRRNGEWSVSWTEPFIVTVSYEARVQVTVKYGNLE